jgi:ionotropic kainate glutamate receptor 2
VQYGSEVSPGNWNGMIGEVLDGTADFAIADISITSKRASAVKFTMPWMNLGISILYTRPRPAPPSMLAFLDPFTTDVSIPYMPCYSFPEIEMYTVKDCFGFNIMP